MFSQLSSPATREFTRRLRRFGYGFDHVADRGHLRRALEKVNYAGGTRPLSISKERVERIVCELRITDFSRYNSSFRPPIRRLVWKFERWKFRWKERGCSRLEKYWRTLRTIRKCNRRIISLYQLLDRKNSEIEQRSRGANAPIFFHLQRLTRASLYYLTDQPTSTVYCTLVPRLSGNRRLLTAIISSITTDRFKKSADGWIIRS